MNCVELGHLCGDQYDSLVYGDKESNSAAAREKRRARILASSGKNEEDDDVVAITRTGSRISVVSEEKKSESVDEVILGGDEEEQPPVYVKPPGSKREGTSFFEGNPGRESPTKVMIQSKDSRPLPRPSTMNGRAKRNRTKQLSMPLQQQQSTTAAASTSSFFFQSQEQPKPEEEATTKANNDGFASMYDTIVQMFCTTNATTQIASAETTEVHVERVPTQEQLSQKNKGLDDIRLLCTPDCGQIASSENSEVLVERVPAQDRSKKSGIDDEQTVETSASTPDRTIPTGEAGSPDSADTIPSVEQESNATPSQEVESATTVTPEKAVVVASTKSKSGKVTPVNSQKNESKKGKTPQAPVKKKGIRGLFGKKASSKGKSSLKTASSAAVNGVPSKTKPADIKESDSAEEEDNAEVVAILFPEKDDNNSPKRKETAPPKRSATPATAPGASQKDSSKKGKAAPSKKSKAHTAASDKAEPLKRSSSAPKDSPSRRAWFKKNSPNSSPERPPSTPAIMQATFGRPKTPSTASPKNSKSASQKASTKSSPAKSTEKQSSNEKSPSTNNEATENPPNPSTTEAAENLTRQERDANDPKFGDQPNLIAPPFVQRASQLEKSSTSPKTLHKTSSRRKTPLMRKTTSALTSIDEDKAGSESLPPRTTSLVQNDEDALATTYKTDKTSSMISEGGESEMTEDPSILSGEDASMYSASMASQDPSLFSHQTQDMNLAQFGKSILKEMRRPGSFKRDDFNLFPKNASIADLLPTKIAEGDNEDADEEEEDGEEDSIEEYGQVWEKP